MALESATYISGLVATNPTSSDNVSDGDNHIRLLKSTIKASFPNITGALSSTHTAIDSAVSIANAATSANSASAVVRRDSSGNFTAGTITAALTGNASTASAWQTARTLTFTGDATGSGSVDGSANVSIALTVGDDSHNHIIANVDGLQTTLDDKASLTGSYANPTWITSLAGTKVTGNISGNAANVTGTVALANGGTGATTATAARSALSAAKSGANSDITSLTGLTTALSLVQGGTGSTTSTGARTNIEAAKSGANSDITSIGGLTTALSIAQGGTGSTTAAAALAALGGIEGDLKHNSASSLGISWDIGGTTYILQAGSGSLAGNTTGSITFPTSFTTKAFCIVSGGASSTGVEGDIHSYATSTTGASIINSGGSSGTYFWIALGY
jgi:hypothetical protein